MDFLLGDKEVFRFAWHALKTRYGKPSRWVSSTGMQIGDYYCGHSFAQHHPDTGAVAFIHGGELKTMAKEVMQWRRETGQGVYSHYKRSEYNEKPSVNVEVDFIWDEAHYLPNRPDSIQIGWCVDLPAESAKPLDEIAPGFENAFQDIGGYWRLEE